MKRMATLDILRGFALMGIIFINIQQMVPASRDHTELEWGILQLLDFAVNHRFFVIFAFLFGVGFQLFLSRAEARGERQPRLLFLRRLLILFLIGLVHHYFQSGEVLAIYAILGLLLLPFYRAKTVYVLAGAIVVIAAGCYLGPVITTLGMFLLGHWAGLIGLFKETERYHTGLRAAQIISLLLIVPMYLAQRAFLNNTGYLDVALSVGALPVSVFYVTTLTLLMRRKAMQKLLAPLGALGRMALTNYLMQTVIIVSLARLLDWPGKVNLLTLAAAPVVILVLQLLASTLWLKRFPMGPVEYLWRLGTYGRQRMNSRLAADPALEKAPVSIR
ncbi:DUF418 domain-containing protein [Paenibacillus albidus]|uniref:DUF418 domain-containing protein n=1 Tax=Paenibacillus albidus TaxID=2041023 RepID=UPI001BEAD583|nr:DUF418 domain-containing protein [Paenibacillus albidus]MBT2290990.1 DUF418 domain-containing protein [Paenibacillus albidus]